jgi:tetratricopeptide (TPR) repeat protein
MGDIDGAIKAFCRATFINPQDADAHYNSGGLLSKQGHLDDAAENYIRVIAMQPDYVNAHYNLGNLFKELR